MNPVKTILAAAAACLAVPVAAHAAVATFSYANVQYSPTLTGTYTALPITGSPTTGYLVLPPAAGFYRFGLQVTVTGNPNAAVASTFATPQPALLGLNSFGQNLTPSNSAATPVATGGNRVVNLFDVRSNGSTVGNVLNGISGGVLPANIDPSDSATFPKGQIGVGAPANIYTNLTYQITNIPVTLNSVITDVAFVVNATVGDAANSPTYTARIAGAGDTIVGPGSLTFGLPEPASLCVVGVGGVGLLARRRKT